MSGLPTTAIVAVGDGGRGFLVRSSTLPLVITAAHCLPSLPRAYGCCPNSVEHTVFDVLGPLAGKRSIAAECRFVDPIADLAVLGPPDGQALPDEADAYDALVTDRPALPLDALRRRSRAWVCSLANEWQPCTVEIGGGGYAVTVIDGHLVGGMSGSPIVTSRGAAVAVVTLGSLSAGVELPEQHGQPSLVSRLPGWLLAELWPSLDRWPRIVTRQRSEWERGLRRSYRAALKRARGPATLPHDRRSPRPPSR